MYFLYCRLKANMNVNLKLDLYHSNDLLEPSEDKKLLSQLGLKEKNVSISLHARVLMFSDLTEHCLCDY